MTLSGASMDGSVGVLRFVLEDTDVFGLVTCLAVDKPSSSSPHRYIDAGMRRELAFPVVIQCDRHVMGGSILEYQTSAFADPWESLSSS